MSSPFNIVEVTAGGYPLLESRAELIATGSVASGFVDVIDMLPVRTSINGPGDFTASTGYTSRPNTRAADTRHWIDWVVLAEGAGGIAAPGELILRTCILDPANVGTPTTEIYQSKRIVIPGPAFQFGSLAVRVMHSGRFVCPGRVMSATYLNGSVNQTLFNVGVYVRPM